jgi:hypothetical protein
MVYIKVTEKIKIHISCYIVFFPKNRAVYEIMSKNMVKPGKLELIARWTSKATRSQSHAVIHLLLIQGNNDFRGSATTLRYDYIACLLLREFVDAEKFHCAH